MTDTTSKIINFYELPEVQKFAIQHHNPTYNKKTQPIKHPFRMVVCGATGSGKSNILLNIIMALNGTFEKIIIFTQNKQEQLYKFLEDKIDDIKIFEGIGKVKNYNFDSIGDEQTLIIFDDMCIEKEKDQKDICELYIRGRKMAEEKGISLIYLTQSYFQVPPIIRKQMDLLILRKVNGKRDLNAILSECSLGKDNKDKLFNLYELCCDPYDITTFLLINLSASENERFRFRFDDIIDINDL